MLDHLKNEFNKTNTANGAPAFKSTKSYVLDLFAFGGAYRNRSENDIIQLFSKALAENPLLAMRTLFYLRDIRGGQGERRFFRVCLKYLADNHPEYLKKNLHLISEFGRWDDILVLLDTKLKNDVLDVIAKQWEIDIKSEHPSLMAKWLPSVKSLKAEKRRWVAWIYRRLGLDSHQYRKMRSKLLRKLDVVEVKMSLNQWDKINYNHVPSRAMLLYRNALFRHDEERFKKYLEAVAAGRAKVNARTLYPYEIVEQILHKYWRLTSDDIKLFNEQWKALPDYIGDKQENSIAVVDTSGSMHGRPIAVAISLGMYLAERNKGPFHNHFITFSAEPELQQITGKNIAEKVNNLSHANWDMNTDIEAVFRLLLKVAVENKVSQEEMVKKVYIITDGQFDTMTTNADAHIFETLRKEYLEHGYQLPHLVFWNVNAFMSNVQYTMNDLGVTLVSGFSPSIFEQLMRPDLKTPYDFMLDVINSKRYQVVQI